LSAVEGRSMRPTFVHVLTGLLLGTALAGLLNVPGRVVAHQESIPPVRSPHAAKPTKDVVVRVSPSVERALEAERGRRAKPLPKPHASPRVVYRRVVVRVPQPPPSPVVASPSPPPKGEEPEPQPAPLVPQPPPPAPPAPEAPRVVVGEPPPAAEDDDDSGRKHQKKAKKPKKQKKQKKTKKPKKDKAETTDNEDQPTDEGGKKDKKDKEHKGGGGD
jgi:hypothetical protein